MAMRDYEELVNSLKNCVYIPCNETQKEKCLAGKETDCKRELMAIAANAIEELSLVCRTQKAAFDAYIDKTPKWISVEARLPEERVWVLCQCRAKIRMVLRWQDGGWYQDTRHRYMSGFVTHWMPLPAPPKEEEHDER